METLEELRGFLAATTPQGVRARLLPIGEARATIRRGGELPDDAPAFRAGLDSDLKDYGLSVLRASLAYREANGDTEVWRLGFLRAGEVPSRVVLEFGDAISGISRVSGQAARSIG